MKHVDTVELDAGPKIHVERLRDRRVQLIFEEEGHDPASAVLRRAEVERLGRALNEAAGLAGKPPMRAASQARRRL